MIPLKQKNPDNNDDNLLNESSKGSHDLDTNSTEITTSQHQDDDEFYHMYYDTFSQDDDEYSMYGDPSDTTDDEYLPIYDPSFVYTKQNSLDEDREGKLDSE